MTIALFTVLLALGSLLAGFLGSLTGLGGGVVIVPLLALVFHVDMRYAIGASLVSVIATSSGAAAAYVREGYSNMRIGMFLEIATTFGAIVGAMIAAHVATSTIAIVFGAVLLYSAYLSLRPRPADAPDPNEDRLARVLRLDGSYPTPQGPEHYTVHHIPLGFGLMFGAGTLSGLLGIGSGAVKVLAMDQAMRVPFKVSTTTRVRAPISTRAPSMDPASAGVYLSRGYIDPGIAMPVVLGALAGSMLGARVLMGARTRVLRMVFSGVIFALGAEMIVNGLTHRL
jgi:uncharacterized membrane protein YfcA